MKASDTHDLETKATDDVDSSDVDYQNIDLGDGVRVTNSADMGMFIHFKSVSGNESGMFLGNTHETPGHVWAKELLELAEIRKADQWPDDIRCREPVGSPIKLNHIEFTCPKCGFKRINGVCLCKELGIATNGDH